MTIWHLLVLSFVLTFLATAAVRFHQIRVDSRRRQEARAAWEARRDRKRQAERDRSLSREVARCFPFLVDGLKAWVKAGASMRDTLIQAVRSVEGVELGTTLGGIPVALPAHLRSRHALLWGKSGYGKSSTMIHMIAADF